MNYLIPFSASRKLLPLFKLLELIPGLTISMEMNTLEDAFVNIGMEEEKH
jgi:ATP-binding cassette subfamily A (ABC1) protein 3